MQRNASVAGLISGDYLENLSINRGKQQRNFVIARLSNSSCLLSACRLKISDIT